jgi:hypothetical protein
MSLKETKWLGGHARLKLTRNCHKNGLEFSKEVKKQVKMFQKKLWKQEQSRSDCSD